MNRFLPPSPHDCQVSVLLLLRLMTAAAKMKENQTSVEKYVPSVEFVAVASAEC